MNPKFGVRRYRHYTKKSLAQRGQILPVAPKLLRGSGKYCPLNVFKIFRVALAFDKMKYKDPRHFCLKTIFVFKLIRSETCGVCDHFLLLRSNRAYIS